MNIYVMTTDEIMSWGPCYTRRQVAALVGDGATLRDVLDLDIPTEDRVWVACEYLARHDRHLLTCWLGDICERAIRLYCIGCGVAEVERWARAWIDGESWAHTEDAAWAAVGAAAWAAAWDAARAAAGAARAAVGAARAAAEAVRDTVRAARAAWAAAWDAARAAAGAARAAGAAGAARAAGAESCWQVDQLRRLAGGRGW